MREYTVLWAGKYYQNWENELHSHSYYQIVSILKGTGAIQIGERRFDFSEQDTFLLHPHVPHGILKKSPDDHPQMMDIKFSIADGPLAADVALLPERLDKAASAQFQYYFNQILKESERNLSYCYERICLYFGLALTSILRAGESGSHFEPPIAPEEKPAVQAGGVNLDRIIQYIHQNYASPISLESMAKEAIVSRSTLIQAFKQAYGTTPVKYINRVRLDKAKSLLLNTDSSISEIAEMVGFQSLHYFSRYFKSHENMAPGEYRQRYSRNYYFTYRVPVQSGPDDL